MPPDRYRYCVLSGGPSSITNICSRSCPTIRAGFRTDHEFLLQYPGVGGQCCARRENAISLRRLPRPAEDFGLCHALDCRSGCFLNISTRGGTGRIWYEFRSRAAAKPSSNILSAPARSRSLGLAKLHRAPARRTMFGLAVDGAARSSLFPDMPTLRELGYRDRRSPAIFRRRRAGGNSRALIARLRDEMASV